MEFSSSYSIKTWVSFNWDQLDSNLHYFSLLLHSHQWKPLWSPAKGLRQWDPLSPFLFIFGTEVISRLLLQQESHDLLKGIKIARNCSPITHLLFADDLIIFAKATSAEAVIIKSCLDKYCLWSGQAINISKSLVHFSKNVVASTITSIWGVFPYKQALATSKYLGVPLFFGRSKTAAFQDILEKVSGKMEGWQAKTLSQAGRTMLIKSVATTIPSYAMSTFLLPSFLSSSLDKSFKNFWWGFPKDKSKNLSLKSWSSICLPRNAGGLGFRREHEFNLSLIA
ncbi:uncharacterized protein LOC132190922 [Corylus avellana]|uniref:uncharacterized protein LOC132190922 n=1 Tax=Corylus avellana TaxID=13451 RepID=UPI00286D2AA9|nr:uncharacterized protein LOC132190922 [Corylus avellana]